LSATALAPQVPPGHLSLLSFSQALKPPSRQVMDFRIQYFGKYNRPLYMDEVNVDTLDIALERARVIVNEADPSFADPAITGYVILDVRGRLVARGYKR
jgi:hypothetical protein